MDDLKQGDVFTIYGHYAPLSRWQRIVEWVRVSVLRRAPAERPLQEFVVLRAVSSTTFTYDSSTFTQNDRR